MIVQGREILRSTVDLVQNNLNLEVISCHSDSEVMDSLIMTMCASLVYHI